MYGSPHKRLKIEQSYVEVFDPGRAVKMSETDLWECEDGVLVLFKTSWKMEHSNTCGRGTTDDYYY